MLRLILKTKYCNRVFSGVYFLNILQLKDIYAHNFKKT